MRLHTVSEATRRVSIHLAGVVLRLVKGLPALGKFSVNNFHYKALPVFEEYRLEYGFAEHADLTAAINILRAGHTRLACQVNGVWIPSATGIHRSERPQPRVYAVGIPVLSTSAASV